jgi:hypothetical protein
MLHELHVMQAPACLPAARGRRVTSQDNLDKNKNWRVSQKLRFRKKKKN